VSRIEEALRRSGAAGARPVPDPAPGEPSDAPPVDPAPGEEHESPWAFDDAAVLRAREEQRRAADAQAATLAPPDGSTPALAPFQGFSNATAEKLVVGSTAAPSFVEQYRKLAATLHHAQVDRGVRVVMIASALPSEGKTLTATNLALTLSESYRRRVLLVDGDLRRPSLHEVFQVPNVAGLSDGLAADSERKLPLIQISPLLSLLAAGRPEPDPMGALTSSRMRQVITEAAAAFDWVVLDTPPVGLMPDANLLAAMVDVAVLVVRSGSTPVAAVQRATAAIGRERVLGVVLNGLDESDISRADGYGYGYGYGRDGASSSALSRRDPRR
jgi:capsular exopolysaccharide synthesis family protein